MSFWDRLESIGEKLDTVSYYELLGVAPDAPAAEILARYYEIAPRLHPDRFARSAPDRLALLNRISARLAEARRVLSSPSLRSAYDQELARGKARLAQEPAASHRPTGPDPKHPLARKLYETARSFLQEGARDRARAHFELARNYEPDSEAIREALAEIERGPEERDASGETGGRAAPSGLETLLRGSAIPAGEPRGAGGGPASDERLPVTVARAHPRVPAALRVKLRMERWDRVQSFVTRDISRGGLFLRGPYQRASPGAAVRLAILLPDGEELDIPAEVARVDEGSAGPAGLGLRFLDVPAETAQRIEELISSLKDGTGSKAAAAESSLEFLVSELVRIRDLPARQLLGVAAGASREELAGAYRETVRRYHPGGATDESIVSVSKEILARVRDAYESLLEESSAGASAGVAPAPAPPPGPPSAESTDPQRPLEARPALSPDVLADLGDPALGPPADRPLSEAAARALELIVEGRYREALELIAEVAPETGAPPRLRAAGHVARGYLARQGGRREEARREFTTALAIDRTCREAILELRRSKKRSRQGP